MIEAIMFTIAFIAVALSAFSYGVAYGFNKSLDAMRERPEPICGRCIAAVEACRCTDSDEVRRN